MKTINQEKIIHAKKNKQFTIRMIWALTFALVILIGAVLVDHYGAGRVSLMPRDSHLPDSAFVYTLAWSNDIFFMDSDGENISSFWLDSNALFTPEDPLAIGENITSDALGNIYLRWRDINVTNPDSGFPIMITAEGEVHQCQNAPYGRGRIIQISAGRILIVNDNGTAPDQVEIFNLLECEYEDTVYEAIGQENIIEASQSSTGRLVLWEKLPGESRSGISVYEGPERVFYIPEATYPTWSHDGNRLAYLIPRDSSDEDYQLWVYDFRSNESTLLFNSDTYITPPSWAPDDEQIAFGTRDRLVVYDFGCGCSSETVIGEYVIPTWR